MKKILLLSFMFFVTVAFALSQRSLSGNYDEQYIHLVLPFFDSHGRAQITRTKEKVVHAGFNHDLSQKTGHKVNGATLIEFGMNFGASLPDKVIFGTNEGQIKKSFNCRDTGAIDIRIGYKHKKIDL